MLDVPTFQRTFPVFRRTDPSVVEAAIARAQRWVSPTVWGANTDDGVGLLAAHFLVLDPSGTSTQLDPDKTSTYKVQFDELRDSIVIGIAGGGCGV